MMNYVDGKMGIVLTAVKEEGYKFNFLNRH
jgi:hypothetical protein